MLLVRRDLPGPSMDRIWTSKQPRSDKYRVSTRPHRASYKVCSLRPAAVPQANTIVTFAVNPDAHSHLDLPFPDPRYLKLHAAACRVAHLSGAAEYMEQHERVEELMKVLARDGSSTRTL